MTRSTTLDSISVLVVVALWVILWLVVVKLLRNWRKYFRPTEWRLKERERLRDEEAKLRGEESERALSLYRAARQLIRDLGDGTAYQDAVLDMREVVTEHQEGTKGTVYGSSSTKLLSIHSSTQLVLEVAGKRWVRSGGELPSVGSGDVLSQFVRTRSLGT